MLKMCTDTCVNHCTKLFVTVLRFNQNWKVVLNLSQTLHVTFNIYLFRSSRVVTRRIRDQMKLTGAHYNLSLLPSLGIICTDNGGSIFLRHGGTHLQDYMAS
jgi:hypothetical protein